MWGGWKKTWGVQPPTPRQFQHWPCQVSVATWAAPFNYGWTTQRLFWLEMTIDMIKSASQARPAPVPAIISLGVSIIIRLDHSKWMYLYNICVCIVVFCEWLLSALSPPLVLVFWAIWSWQTVPQWGKTHWGMSAWLVPHWGTNCIDNSSNKRTECESSQFGSNRGRNIPQPMQQMRNASQQRVLNGQSARAHLWRFRLPGPPSLWALQIAKNTA